MVVGHRHGVGMGKAEDFIAMALVLVNSMVLYWFIILLIYNAFYN